MAKTCQICGEDCSNRPRTKDPKGRYYCAGCYERKMREAQAVEVAAPKPEAARKSPFKSILTFRNVACVTLLILAGTYFLSDRFTFFFALFLAFAMFNGYWLGAIRIGALLGGLVAGALVGIPVGRQLEGVCTTLLGTTGIMNRAISIVSISIITFVVTTLILKFMISRLCSEQKTIRRYDKAAGAGLGLLEGVLIACLAIWSLLALEPLATMSVAQSVNLGGPGGFGDTEATEATGANPVTSWVVSTARTVRESTAGNMVNTSNPMSETRYLPLLADGVVIVSNPESREAFLNHPGMKRVETNEAVQQALKILSEDEALMESMDSGQMPDIFKAILTSQTLLDVFDKTDLVSELGPLAKDIELAIVEVKTKSAE